MASTPSDSQAGFVMEGRHTIGSDAFLGGLVLSVDIIGQMGLLVLLGFFMVRKGWLSSNTLTDLTRVLIDVVIPCTFILAMARSFTFGFFQRGFVPALVAAGWIAASWGFGALWFSLFPGDSVNRDRSVTAMMMISNSIYLPLPVILAVVPVSMHDTATMYISIVALPSILMMWTAGVGLLSGSSGPSPGERLKMVFNAPIVSVVAGILLTLIPGVREAAMSEPGSFFPVKMLFSGMGYLSRILSPLAMLILGGMIASGGGSRRVPMKYVVPLIGVRLLLIPAVVYGLIRSGLLVLPSLAGTALLLVAAAPPATNHALIARRYHGEWALVSELQLITHVVALVTLPLWLSVGLGL